MLCCSVKQTAANNQKTPNKETMTKTANPGEQGESGLHHIVRFKCLVFSKNIYQKAFTETRKSNLFKGNKIKKLLLKRPNGRSMKF